MKVRATRSRARTVLKVEIGGYSQRPAAKLIDSKTHHHESFSGRCWNPASVPRHSPVATADTQHNAGETKASFSWRPA